MSFVVAQWTAGLFSFISLVHLYWAAGGKRGSDAAIPRISGDFPGGSRAAFKPSAVGTFLVAVGLLFIAFLVCLRVGWFIQPVDHWALQWGISTIALVMFARAIGDSELVGLFKKVKNSRFATLDTWIYAPLCVLLGAGLLVVAWA